MQFKIKSQEDFWSGLMFIGFGILAIFIARDYPMGTTMRMGPGYFPTGIGIFLIVLGAIIATMGLKNEGEGIGKWGWRAMILLSIGFAIFGWSIDHIGFIPALFILIVLAAFAGKVFNFKEVMLESIVLILGAWALFIWGLELPFPLFWWR